MFRVFFISTLLLFFKGSILNGQGLSNHFLLGYQDTTDQYTTAARAEINFNGGVATINPDSRKMNFRDTQANISDEHGNILMSSNGIWIANASGDTMQNGSGLNPGLFTDNYSDGLPLANGNVFIPYPGDSSKYILFHMTGDYNLSGRASALYYSVIDMTLDGGFGGVVNKNTVIFNDTLSWGIGACKHANGRDWWIIALKDSSDIIYKIRFTSNGVESVTSQSMGSPINFYGNNTQLTFSPDGNKFAYTSGYGPPPWYFDVRLFNFDRCTGMFYNYLNIPLNDTHPGFGTAFSPDSKYLYAASTYHIFQINTDTADIAASLDSIANNDGFYSPVSPFLDNFWLMYLGADGKIYITAGNSVVDLHCINYPNNDGVASDVAQHSIHLPCYNSRTVPFHPNYYLGAEGGTLCDSLSTGISDLTARDFNLNVYPNPLADEEIQFTYDVITTKATLNIFDLQGRRVRGVNLPMWSTRQSVVLPNLESGIYFATLNMNGREVVRKFVVEK